jgi:ABC-type Fe3+ transport system permease subunit
VKAWHRLILALWSSTMRMAASLSVGLGGALLAAPAWADHPGGLRSEPWSPLTTALVFGGLALLAGAVVVIVVATLTRRDPTEE